MKKITDKAGIIVLLYHTANQNNYKYLFENLCNKDMYFIFCEAVQVNFYQNINKNFLDRT
ncbi:hypothetical protein D7X98_09945 [bacterium 1XD8-76]|nr:hypothetical protein D7X98_09945 [bacterium 1XD8-76]